LALQMLSPHVHLHLPSGLTCFVVFYLLTGHSHIEFSPLAPFPPIVANPRSFLDFGILKVPF
jgi:hypothetical protein